MNQETYDPPIKPTDPAIDEQTDITAPINSSVSYTTASAGAEGTTTTVVMAETKISSGPLPQPETLKEYDIIIPGGAERIMAMAEKEQETRLEEKKKNGDSNRKIAEEKVAYYKRGQWMGFSLAIIVLGISVVFACLGFETLSGIILGTTLVALVGLFVYSTRIQKKE